MEEFSASSFQQHLSLLQWCVGQMRAAPKFGTAVLSEFQLNPQKHRARTPEMTNPRQLAQPSSTRVLIGAVNTPAYSSGHGRTHPHMHTCSHGWLHLIESWSNLIFHSFATMAAIEEPVTCLNLCRHPVTGNPGIVFHTFFHTTELSTHVWTRVLRF